MIANFNHIDGKSTIGGYKFSFSFKKFYKGIYIHIVGRASEETLPLSELLDNGFSQ